MPQLSVYLSGNISSDPQTYTWREQATKLLEPEFLILNPVANPFNTELLYKHNLQTPVGDFLDDVFERSQRLLIHKDYNSVRQADIILANLKLVSTDKPLIGTIFELAWAWQLQKPIIAVVDHGVFSKHIFCRAAISAAVYTVEAACNMIFEFFSIHKGGV